MGVQEIAYMFGYFSCVDDCSAAVALRTLTPDFHEDNSVSVFDCNIVFLSEKLPCGSYDLEGLSKIVET